MVYILQVTIQGILWFIKQFSPSLFAFFGWLKTKILTFFGVGTAAFSAMTLAEKTKSVLGWAFFLSVSALFIGSFVAYYVAAFKLISYLFSYLNTFLGMINNPVAVAGGNSDVDYVMQIVSSTGILAALKDAWDFFSVIFTAIFTMIVSSFTFKSIVKVADFIFTPFGFK